jgi:hypothetical protein
MNTKLFGATLQIKFNKFSVKLEAVSERVASVFLFYPVNQAVKQA